jgi:HK97 family phage prohead protease
MLKKICEAAEFKLLDEGSGSFSGYGSTFLNADRVGDVIAKGAFRKSLTAFVENGCVPVGHQWDELPVATISEAYEDAKGLFVKADFHSTPEAQAARTVVRERLERGKSVGLSIGFEIKDSERTKEGRVLKEIELLELSIVTIPCNPMAQATEAKSAEDAEPQVSEAPPAGVSLADAYDAALAAVADVIDRTTQVKDLRDQEGRRLSEERRAQLAALIAKAQALHEATRPRIDEATLLRLKAEHLARVARARAATLPD